MQLTPYLCIILSVPSPAYYIFFHSSTIDVSIHICVDSIQALLEHHRSFIPSTLLVLKPAGRKKSNQKPNPEPCTQAAFALTTDNIIIIVIINLPVLLYVPRNHISGMCPCGSTEITSYVSASSGTGDCSNAPIHDQQHTGEQLSAI